MGRPPARGRTTAERYAVEQVRRELAAKGHYSKADIRRATGLDPSTVRKFLEGSTWPPEITTMIAFESAIGQEIGYIRFLIDSYVEGEILRDTSPRTELESKVLRCSRCFSDNEKVQILQALRGFNTPD